MASSTVPVIVSGETGTGKEVVARAVHRMSGRAGPFVAINCGAIPPTLVESELFGAKRGSYSGASEDRPGLVRTADKGTLLLDEIAELSLAAQVALLRVLQEQAHQPDEDAARKTQLLALLGQHNGRIADVARAMGKARMQIHRWIQRYDIDLESFRKAKS